MVSDGNLLLSGAGRAFNYRGHVENPPTADDVDDAFQHLLQPTRLRPESRRRLPDLQTADALAMTARLTPMQGLRIPDRVIFLDLPPAAAVSRAPSRRAQGDRAEHP